MEELKVCMVLNYIDCQVCPIVLAQHLKAIGIPQVSYFKYWRGGNGLVEGPECWHGPTSDDKFLPDAEEVIAAHTSAELGAMLPPLAMTRRFLNRPDMWLCDLPGVGGYPGESEAAARAKVLLRMHGIVNPDIPLDIPDSPVSENHMR